MTLPDYDHLMGITKTRLLVEFSELLNEVLPHPDDRLVDYLWDTGKWFRDGYPSRYDNARNTPKEPHNE